MSKFNIEEVKAMSFEDQIVELEKQIQRVREARERNAANIRQLEEMTENCNDQLETLIELKWSCKLQHRMNEMSRALEDYNNNPGDTEWMNEIESNNKTKMNITMEQYHDYLSLYDYLGRAAGHKLGADVNKEAVEKGIEFKQRFISLPSYQGNVHLYPVEFLDEYFKSLEEST